jgi:hypothetical protein
VDSIERRGLEPILDHIYLIKENYSILDVARQEVEDNNTFEHAMNNQEPEQYVKMNANASLDSDVQSMYQSVATIHQHNLYQSEKSTADVQKQEDNELDINKLASLKQGKQL